MTPPVDKTQGFSGAERVAMQDRARKLKTPKAPKRSGEQDMMDKISLMTPTEQKIARQIHALVTLHAPHIVPKTWYEMPA